MTTRGARLIALVLLAITAVLTALGFVILFSSSLRLAAVFFAVAMGLCSTAIIFLGGAAMAEIRARRRKDDER